MKVWKVIFQESSYIYIVLASDLNNAIVKATNSMINSFGKSEAPILHITSITCLNEYQGLE